MKDLGNTFEEVLEASELSPTAADSLYDYVLETLEVDMDDEDRLFEIMTTPLDESVDFGGRFLFVETEEDIDTMTETLECQDIRETPDRDEPLFDMIGYLDEECESTVILMIATNNGGGDCYVISDILLEKHPSIHAHVFCANVD